MTVDTLTITRQLVAAVSVCGLLAVADALREANQDFVTKADLRAELAVLRSDLYRALWLQTGAIVAAVAGLLAIVSRLP